MTHNLLLTTRQTTKIRNTFGNDISIDIKLSKAQISKIIQLGELIGKTLGKLGKRVSIDLAASLAKDVLHKLAT